VYNPSTGWFEIDGYVSDMQIESSCSFIDVTSMGETFKKEIPDISIRRGTFTMEIVNMQIFRDMLSFVYERLLPGIREAISKKIVL
jgi:hypothetical protein